MDNECLFTHPQRRRYILYIQVQLWVRIPLMTRCTWYNIMW